MNYLKISNKGLICPEDLMLIGSSTKREQTGKIGMFGSGWKYALAWLLRNETNPIIYSGEKQISIDYEVTLHRNNPVNVITVNGEKTSLTTEMGPKWTGWMAIREVLSNAIDEGEHSITTAWLPEFKGFDDQTTIYIPMNGELSEVMLKFDTYFAFYRKESFANESCRMFFKTEESNLNIYRMGIRCYDTNVKSKVDFDFRDIAISEDRLTNDTAICQKVHKLIKEGLPTAILKRLILENKYTWLPSEITEPLLNGLIELAQQGETFTTETLQKLGGILFSNPNSLIIPVSWFEKLDTLGLVKNPFEKIGGTYNFIRTDAKDLKGFEYNLSGLNLKLKCFSGKCETDIFFNAGNVYVKDDTQYDDRELVGKLLYSMTINELSSLVPA